ncbi:hypothetical protein F4604DRAFT_1747116 [Suillus subluteus]|nr:hypothetical protein F4604DRAFT_1747116 [Suillus subluteus]
MSCRCIPIYLGSIVMVHAVPQVCPWNVEFVVFQIQKTRRSLTLDWASLGWASWALSQRIALQVGLSMDKESVGSTSHRCHDSCT